VWPSPALEALAPALGLRSWADELQPSDDGYARAAARFHEVLEQALAASVPLSGAKAGPAH